MVLGRDSDSVAKKHLIGLESDARCFFLFVCLFVFCLFSAACAAYGGSQARGLIGAVAVGLRQGHSNARSKPSPQPTLQLSATPDL